MVGFEPPGGVYTHVVGIDLVRTGPDEFMVLEDNAVRHQASPTCLENRETMMAMFPELFSRIAVCPVQDYPQRLARSLAACAPGQVGSAPTAGRSSPSSRPESTRPILSMPSLPTRWEQNSVEGSDLRVVDSRIAMRTTYGWPPIDVLYRRVDDAYLDPFLTFQANSVLGIPGIMDIYRAGGVTIANAPGTGIADDKAIYSFMPEIVEFYTGEKPILQSDPDLAGVQ